MIAMALVMQPALLIADEPTTALDVTIQAQILELLAKLRAEHGTAMLLITHDLGVVWQTADRVAVMYAGEIVESGPMDALYHEPRHPYTRLLFAATPDLESRDVVVSIPGAPPRLDEPLAGCPFRPRCAEAFERCSGERPRLRRVGAEHESACHLAAEVPV
jgi:oligopeptide/dipeptide ABC transporter ATP-binding protein